MADEKVIVGIEFNLPEEHGKLSRNSIVICKPKTNIDPNYVTDNAKESNTSYDYSGRHDNGSLPKLRNGGDLNLLLSSLYEAKHDSDTYLTSVISSSLLFQDSIPKKPRIEDIDND